MRSVLILPVLLVAACGADPLDLAVSAMNRGLVALESGRPAGAIPLFEEALRHHPDWHEAKINLAVACFHARDDRLGAALDTLGEDPRALFLRGVSLRMAGKATEALPFLRRLAKVAPGDPHACCWLGLAARDAGLKAEAEEAFHRCCFLRPAQTALRLMGDMTDYGEGKPIRGRYEDWGPMAHAVNEFPEIDLPLADLGDFVALRLESGLEVGTMESAADGTSGSGDTHVVIRAGRRRVTNLQAFLGDADRVDYVQVTWPSGRLTAHGPLPVNQIVTIRESSP